MIRQGSFASQKAEPPYLSQNAGNEKAGDSGYKRENRDDFLTDLEYRKETSNPSAFLGYNRILDNIYKFQPMLK